MKNTVKGLSSEKRTSMKNVAMTFLVLISMVSNNCFSREWHQEEIRKKIVVETATEYGMDGFIIKECEINYGEESCRPVGERLFTLK